MSEPASIDPASIPGRRAAGWPDVHPEDFCHRCGRRNFVWFVNGETWRVATAHLPRAELEILCPSCFADAYFEATGTSCMWELRASTPFTEGR